jgi:hypothetical protein
MLTIYSETITERLIYTFNFIFKDRNIDYKFTNDKAYILQTNTPKLNFSKLDLTEIYKIEPSGFLFDESIILPELSLGEFSGMDTLCFNGTTDLPASLFYCISRFEEYGSNQRDQHDRYLSKFSIQTKYNWIESTICDRWAEHFIHTLEKNLGIEFNAVTPEYSYVPTFDIDNTFAFKWKNRWRQVAAKWREKLKGDTDRIEARKNFTTNSAKDPYDTFDHISSLSKTTLKPIVFWHLGDYSNFDNNIHWQDQRHQKLIQFMAETTEIGLHPSYKSNSSFTILTKEKNRLNSILGSEKIATRSRQHFLKLKIPHTYQRLIKAGFTHDYTMGYADCVGFRAGTARPHFFFDLEHNEPTKLLIHPFAYMDGTLNEYLKLKPIDAEAKIKELVHEVKKYGGEFICIWHNETIGDFGKWKGWKAVLEYTNRIANA